jgi:hypothetical protein
MMMMMVMASIKNVPVCPVLLRQAKVLIRAQTILSASTQIHIQNVLALCRATLLLAQELINAPLRVIV